MKTGFIWPWFSAFGHGQALLQMPSPMTPQSSCDTLEIALWRRKRPKNIIKHISRSGQFYSTGYKNLLKCHNMQGGVSTRTVIIIIPVQKAFHRRWWNVSAASREIMRAAMLNCIEYKCNLWRRQSVYSGHNPEQFETRMLIRAAHHITQLGSMHFLWLIVNCLVGHLL